MTRCRLGACLAALLTFGTVGLSAAQDDKLMKAGEAEADGVQHYQAGRFMKAILAYEKAYAFNADPNYLFVLASAYEQLPDRCPDAMLGWERFLGTCAKCSKREAGLSRSERLKARCTAKLKIETTPAGALVTVDGASTGKKTPVTIEVLDGEHEIQLALAGHPALKKKIDARGGREIGLKHTFTAKAAVVAPKPKPVVKKKPVEKKKPVAAKKPVEEEPPPEDSEAMDETEVGSQSNTLSWVLIGGGVVGIVVGGALVSQALAEQENIEEDGDDASVSVANLEIGYWLAFGAGTVGIITGILLMDSNDEPSAMVPIIGPGHVGLRFAF